MAALSETLLAVESLSVTGPMAASEVSSLRLTVKLSVEVEPSVEVARTVMLCEVAVS